MTAGRGYIAAMLVEEFRQSGDWVTVAGAVELIDISSFVAEKPVVRAVLRCVNDNPTMHLISAHLGYRRMPKPIPIEPLLSEIFAKPEASDRAAARWSTSSTSTMSRMTDLPRVPAGGVPTRKTRR